MGRTLLHKTRRLLHRNCRLFHRSRADPGRILGETGAFRVRVSSEAELSTEDLPSAGEILKAVGSTFIMPKLPRVLRTLLPGAVEDSRLPHSKWTRPFLGPRGTRENRHPRRRPQRLRPTEEIRCSLFERSARRKAKRARPTLGRWTIPTTPPHTPRSPGSERRCQQ